eukprot:CAMPEP_0183333770 /NCGR_PEP_ID=MMETSP0164_2-20130417/2579_1 /TAXON_ID=221442 /ORGANISM="Coccolithus pelagicus ssp braarudi, Strain PLY182g" /LENGTH=54 /DNA_ID=CAMNT_0025502775 /DNA_START=376 /DNA_END=540 /DNA_ORIENTATION=+
MAACQVEVVDARCIARTEWCCSDINIRRMARREGHRAIIGLAESGEVRKSLKAP